MLLQECGLPLGQLERGDRQRLHGRQRARRRPRHRAHHVHRFARRRLGDQGPGAAQEGRPRARQQRSGDHRVRRQLEGRRRTRSGSPGSAMPASRASRRNASTYIVPWSTTSQPALAERVRTLVVGDPLDEATEVSALDLHAASASGSMSWIEEAVAGGAKVVVGGERRCRWRARADGAHRRRRPT